MLSTASYRLRKAVNLEGLDTAPRSLSGARNKKSCCAVAWRIGCPEDWRMILGVLEMPAEISS